LHKELHLLQREPKHIPIRSQQVRRGQVRSDAEDSGRRDIGPYQSDAHQRQVPAGPVDFPERVQHIRRNRPRQREVYTADRGIYVVPCGQVVYRILEFQRVSNCYILLVAV